MRTDSRAVHAGREPGRREPLAPPLVQASAYVFDDLEDYDLVASGEVPGHVYGRSSNENTQWLERAVAELEGAPAGLATASGMAALLVALLALAPRPAPIVAAADLYGVTLALLHQDLAPLGYLIREVDPTDLEAVDRALPGAAVLLVETLSNPLCRVSDLDALAASCARHGAVLLVDNTLASPLLCRPLEHGAGAVVHSVTKYLGGHSDLVAGVLVGGERMVTAARDRLVRVGASLGPFEAWLALRGMRTLALRMRRHSEVGLHLARGLEGAPGVGAVHHPMLDASGHRAVASRLLPDGTGGMLAIELDGGRDAVQRALGRFRLARFAASFGGVETTVSYPDITSHRSLSPERRLAQGITPGTLRVSAGIEDPRDVLDDFRQAVAP